VVVVGGAAVGSAVAWFLSADPDFDGSVLVVERDRTYATASTTLSVASIRQQFSTPENILMSRFGMAFFSRLKEHFGPDADIGFTHRGYLLLASAQGLGILESNVEIQHDNSVDVALLDAADLAGRFPWLSTEGLAGGALGLSGEGWFDPWSLLTLMSRGARDRGATYVEGEVAAMSRNGATVDNVTLADGETVSCGAVVNAAGPWAGRVAAMAGLVLPVEPRKRYVYVIDCREPPGPCPLVVDPSGVYFRPEGAYFLTGLSPSEDEDSPCDDLEIDHGWFEERIWPVLAARVPAFEAIKVANAWAGHYDYNTLDQNAIVGPHPEVGNFYFANGFSGHGLQQAPAAGRAVAELLVHGRYQAIDLTRFGYERIAGERPLREMNVI
jgi:glycine/D-amino acid oxidase-like deaminating enzyme